MIAGIKRKSDICFGTNYLKPTQIFFIVNCCETTTKFICSNVSRNINVY